MTRRASSHRNHICLECPSECHGGRTAAFIYQKFQVGLRRYSAVLRHISSKLLGFPVPLAETALGYLFITEIAVKCVK